MPERNNWAGNYTYYASVLLTPATVEEAQAIVRDTAQVRALGTRHTFNGIADSDGVQVSLEKLTGITLDEDVRTVTLGAGIRYGELAAWLHQRGYALHNLASLPHISVVGGVATATHGSGLRHGNLATAVTGIDFLNAKGELVSLTREGNPDLFSGVVVALGALGIVTAITLRIEPTYDVAQTVYENLSFDHLKDNLRTIMDAAYSVSLFTTWQDHRAQQVWLKQRVGEPYAPEEFYGATRAATRLHPLAGHDPVNCTEQLGVPGPWHERLPHFRMEFTPSSGAEIQTELFVPIDMGYDAILAVEALREKITPHLHVTELRSVAADDLWMSPNYQRDSLGIHFTWKAEPEAVAKVVPEVEAALQPFGALPHWGKFFTMEPRVLQRRLPNLTRFKNLAYHHDPKGKFLNEFLENTLYL
ncbi:FAD-binding protein [Terriglobus tenax]|uniref:FAD-binding protein n=1 Tax=Terriglobus tenax TaxID=1111115 RepID=UPI0021E05E99|nr:FAD-binding protein [Terriglobus tenax]